MGGVRPARLCEPQRLGPVLHPNSVEFGPRAPGVGRRPSAQARRPLRSQEHSPFTVLRNSSSARPPRAAKASPSPRTAIPQGIALLALSSSGRSLRGPQQRQLRASAAGGFGPRDPKGSQKLGPIHRPKFAPVLRPVSASLRLRYRSAAFAVARGNSCRIGSPPTGRICHLKRAGDGIFVSGSNFFRAPARFILFRLTAEIVESLL